MAEAIVQHLRSSLSTELVEALSQHLTDLQEGNFQAILQHPSARLLFGHESNDLLDNVSLEDFPLWTDYISHRLGLVLRSDVGGIGSGQASLAQQHSLFFIFGLASIASFLQSNVTGPPLPFSSAELLLPSGIQSNPKKLSSTRQELIESLTLDGEAVYRLTPNIELFCLARAIFTCPAVIDHVSSSKWARFRINFIHQRLLSENAPSLQSAIYEDLISTETLTLSKKGGKESTDIFIAFLLERATIHTHHGFEKLAREDLERATKERSFQFALTGLLGKRTKFQQTEISQLVVLARSAHDVTTKSSEDVRQKDNASTAVAESSHAAKPKNIDLDDDTLLESISFSENPKSLVDVKEADSLPSILTDLDPEHQPLLDPLDSIILLSLASSITNTSPANGLTREETAPYATRVLDGGSSNWQIYTQALLIRSRIEGHRSRTVERGLLQLQALVDQVIADTTSHETREGADSAQVTTFLPRAKEGESAPAHQRLRYVFPLCAPLRWELEAELASRWISLGGLRSALEIYQRLEMWPELALCWAATERDDKAKKIVRKQLFHPTNGEVEDIDEETEKWEGEPRDPPPTDAPRLYCILGDLDKDPEMYEKAWQVSNSRYHRAQRSLGRYWFGEREYAKAVLAFSKAVKVKQLDHPTWFALGCALLELNRFSGAVEAFTRSVQLDDADAESWSNLAAALLHLRPEDAADFVVDDTTRTVAAGDPDDMDEASLSDGRGPRDPQKNRKDALKALKHAARLKRESYRIWDNLLTVAASLDPPSYNDIVTAQQQIIELRGTRDGEKCVDVGILDGLVRHVTASGFGVSDDGDGDGDGDGTAAAAALSRKVCRLVDRSIVPLITSSSQLWYIVARLALWRNKPLTALEAHEKAWRAATGPGWENGSEAQWNSVVDATEKLVAAYEDLGPREMTEGLGAGSGQVVSKSWKFKVRSAVRGILGRGKEAWEGTVGWEKLNAIGEQARG